MHNYRSSWRPFRRVLGVWSSNQTKVGALNGQQLLSINGAVYARKSMLSRIRITYYVAFLFGDWPQYLCATRCRLDRIGSDWIGMVVPPVEVSWTEKIVSPLVAILVRSRLPGILLCLASKVRLSRPARQPAAHSPVPSMLTHGTSHLKVTFYVVPYSYGVTFRPSVNLLIRYGALQPGANIPGAQGSSNFPLYS